MAWSIVGCAGETELADLRISPASKQRSSLSSLSYLKSVWYSVNFASCFSPLTAASRSFFACIKPLSSSPSSAASCDAFKTHGVVGERVGRGVMTSELAICVRALV